MRTSKKQREADDRYRQLRRESSDRCDEFHAEGFGSTMFIPGRVSFSLDDAQRLLDYVKIAKAKVQS